MSAKGRSLSYSCAGFGRAASLDWRWSARCSMYHVADAPPQGMLVRAERKQDQPCIRGGDARDALAVKTTLLVRQNMKTAQVEKEIERAIQSRAIEVSDVAADKFDACATSGSPAARDAKCPLDRIDTSRFPT